jgi:hypothetical protein
MGLDITAYRGLKDAPDVKFNADGEPVDEHGRFDDDVFVPYPNPDFKGRADGLERKPYRFDDLFGFRAGSYGGYNMWRDRLAQIAGYPSAPMERPFGGIESRHDHGAFEADGGPFWELILFSDCEGTIGPKVSAKLVKDFHDFQIVADRQDDSFLERYNMFRKAFEWGADDGAVDFH